MSPTFVSRLKIVAQAFNFIVVVLGAWFASQGAMLHSVLALVIGGFNLIILTRVSLQAASRFFLLVPGVFGFIIGAITVGGAVGLWAQGRTDALPRILLTAVSFVMAGGGTVFWLLLAAPAPPQPPQ